jgi:hypothetical protein
MTVMLGITVINPITRNCRMYDNDNILENEDESVTVKERAANYH